MVTMVVMYVKFSIQQCLNYLSSMHSLSASVKGSWVFLNRFLCSIRLSAKEEPSAKHPRVIGAPRIIMLVETHNSGIGIGTPTILGEP